MRKKLGDLSQFNVYAAKADKYDANYNNLYKRSYYNGLDSTSQLIFKEEEAKELGQGWTDSF